MFTLEECRKQLAIDNGQLDVCLTRQPELYYAVGNGYAEAVAERDSVKLELEELQAKLDQDFRAEAARKDEKITEAGLQQKLRTMPKVQELQQKFLDARTEAESWLVLKEAFQQRSFMLRELVALFIAQRRDLDLESGVGQAKASLAESNRTEARRRRLKA